MTIYWARVRYTLTGKEQTIDSASLAALQAALLCLAGHVEILDEGTRLKLPENTVATVVSTWYGDTVH